MAVNRVAGRDPATGELVEISYEHGKITTIARGGSASSLPILAAGLVDLQVNGYAGHDVNGGTQIGDIAGITDSLARAGVTTWVPTVVTAAEEEIIHALRTIQAARAADPVVRAAIPFAHVEGPFLSDRDGPRGVHDREQLRPIDATEVARWLAAGPIGYVTVSPHFDQSSAEIAAMVASGIAVSIGHTHATSAQIHAAVDAGATLSTHLGNGIEELLPRHPNALWAQLADDRLTCGVIADGHHLPADTLRAMVAAKGDGKVFLVSDSVELAGSEPGRYRTAVGGEVELSADGRLSYPGTGLLAGAARNLADGLRFVWQDLGFGAAKALRLCTSTPGDLVRRLGGGPAGRLRVGEPADVIELDDQGSVLGVLRGGRRLR